MARLEGRTGWLSLPEAAEAVHVTLPTLRYLVRRLALALGAAQDDRGDTYVPAARLEDLGRVVRYRNQGLDLAQIERRLLQQNRETGERERRAPARAEARPSPSAIRPPRHGPRAEPPAREHSLPFPFTPVPRTGEFRRLRGRGPAGRHELPHPSDELRRGLEALRQENRELRERLEELVAWLRAKDGAPARETAVPPARPLEPSTTGRRLREFESGPTARPAAVAAAEPQAEFLEGTRLTRTPSGNVRLAVVRSWNPPALNGRH